MFFKCIQIDNFLSHKNSKLDFKPGLYLVDGENKDEGGSNGCGKSVVWDALAWVLFGTTTRGLTGDEVVNWQEKINCRVSLHFEHKGKDCVVTRYRKSKDFGNRITFFIDDYSFEQGTIALTQEKIEDFLSFDLEFFKFTVLFSQNNTFNFVNETDKTQKNILSKVVKIDFDGYLMMAKTEYNEIDVQRLTLENDKKLFLSKILSKEEIGDLEVKAKEYENDRATKITQEGEAITKLTEELKLIEGIQIPDDSRKKELTDEIAKVDALIAKMDDKIIAAMSEARLIGEKLRSLEGLAGLSTCPTCQLPVKTEIVDSFITPLKERFNALNLPKLKDAKRLLQGKREEHSLELIKIKEDIERATFYHRQKMILAKNISLKKESLEYWWKSENLYESQLVKIKRNEEKLKAEIAEIDARIEALDQDFPYYKFWVDAFSDGGIKSYIFDLICGTLSNRTNKFLEMMGRGNFSVFFTTQTTLKSGEVREKFQCMVKKDGEVIPYAACSGGEQRRISIAVDNALAEIMKEHYGQVINLMIFDEQTNYLDASGREGFFNMIKILSRDSIIYVVDHDAEFKSKYNDCLMVVKENGISRFRP